ncbi:asparaginase [Ornithinibacillus sp. L9]|uniref:Asparaginase n=1 Tax=Ornithinibacillus caprae TaxID=2678566 RepID=A0A6N8FF94_9BACI|nr:asparaginase [Ornithinibacillus caprae]MUK88230.1 asparaginase [Ornithinibacillus caprae]
MKAVTLVEETRAGLVENVHTGMICGVNENLETIYHAGDSSHYTYYRSAAKPIQALPVFLSNCIKKYGLTSEEAALFTASHRGESYHIDALESMLNKLPVHENELYCPYSYPLNAKPKKEMLRKNKEKRRLYHNCSGKHMGFITVCREYGYPVEGYWEVDHPLQQHILKLLSELSEVPLAKIHSGLDGCGVPVFAIPLQNMALTYLKLACSELIGDLQVQKAVKQMTSVMNKHPRIVASENFICSELLQDQNIVAKGGAQGVYCFGLKKERMGFALKVLNGSEDVWPVIVASILEQIGYKNKETIARLRALKPSIITNDAGVEVGKVHEKFSLTNM